MAYGDFKNLTERTVVQKILGDKAFNIAKNLKYDGYQRGLVSMVYKYFYKKSSGSGIINNKQNIQFAKELHKQIIRNFKKRTVYSRIKDNIWGDDSADVRLISKFKKGFKFLLCLIDIFSKYCWVVPLKDKKGVSIVDAFQKNLKESNRRRGQSKRCKPNKIWVGKGSELYFCNISFKKWLKDNDIEMYSTHNEGKPVVAERFIR